MSNRWTAESTYDAYERTQRERRCPYCLEQGAPSTDPQDVADAVYAVYVCPMQHRFFVDRKYLTDRKEGEIPSGNEILGE